MRFVLKSLVRCGLPLAAFLLGACQATSHNLATAPTEPTVPAETVPVRQIELQLTARSLGYKLELIEVRQSADTLLTLSRLHPPSGMVGMALETLTVKASVHSSATTVRHLVIGPASGILEPPADVAFVADPSELPALFLRAQPLAVLP